MKNSIKIILILFIPMNLILISCGADAKKEEAAKKEKMEKKSNNPLSDLQRAAEEMEKVLEGEGEVIEPVNFRELKELLPRDFSGFERTDVGGSTQGMMGVNVSKAEGKYKHDDGGRITINILDAGGMQMIVKGMAAWANIEMDKESNGGYERTTEIKGHKAYQKYNGKNRNGETAILVDERFIVTVSGRKVDEKHLKKAVSKLDLKDLKKLNK